MKQLQLFSYQGNGFMCGITKYGIYIMNSLRHCLLRLSDNFPKVVSLWPICVIYILYFCWICLTMENQLISISTDQLNVKKIYFFHLIYK